MHTLECLKLLPALKHCRVVVVPQVVGAVVYPHRLPPA